jgi:uncharacterized protein (DUF1697 family)
MAELRAMLEQIGCQEVQTYVQSGNAVFATTRKATDLTAAIEAPLERYMGRPIATTLRTRAQLAAVVAARPWADVATDPARLCVTFLAHAPTKTEVAPLAAQVFAPERLLVAGKEIYSWHPNGQARSPLAATIGKLRLRGAATTRNFNTVLRLLELLGGP